MNSSDSTHDASVRMQRLLGFLERDPSNLSLLADAAFAAFDAREFEVARDLIVRQGEFGDLPPATINLQALVALAQERFVDAAQGFADLRSSGHDAPEVRFNQAWALAMTNRFEEANDLLDNEVLNASPRAPALKIQMMHHLERYEDALELGRNLAERYPENEALMGALATLAMDAGQVELAQTYAKRAGSNAEGLAARGLFALDSQNSEQAMALFDQSLKRQPNNPRALVGKGLALLAAGQPGEAAEAIDKGAALFGDHLGSWVAAGWTAFIAGDAKGARAKFERIVAMDATFPEGHGGLAVMKLMAGDTEGAKQDCEIALRLDRQSMSGALAKSLLLDLAGDPAAAEKIRTIAMSAPIGPDGQTLAQALASMGSGLVRQ